MIIFLSLALAISIILTIYFATNYYIIKDILYSLMEDNKTLFDESLNRIKKDK